MLSSYQFSERYNAQSLLWDACGLIAGIIRKTTAIVGRVAAFLSHFLPILLLALGLTTACVAGAAVVALIPPTVWLGMLIVGAFGYLTFPKVKAVSRG